jgi:hypothetical protein
LGGAPLPAPDASRFVLAHEAYGGAYGRVSPLATAAAAHVRGRLAVEDTYSAKALAVALRVAASDPAPTLFWLTFDARGLLDD